MRGYRVPSSLIDKIEREALHIGDFSYTDGMDKVIEAIKDLGEVELDNPWHTGTPTEDGWYLCAYDTDIYLANYWCGCGWLKQYRAEGIDCRQGLVAWQKIERIEANKARKK